MASLLQLQQLVAMTGLMPPRGEGMAANYCGMIHTSASRKATYGAPRAAGQALPQAGNPVIYGLIHTDYGAGGAGNFMLPNLVNRVAVGGKPGQNTAETLMLSYVIATTSAMGEGPAIGTVAMFAGDFAPAGWALCNGDLLWIADNVELFSLIGTTYGGDGEVTFALPQLKATGVIGLGPGLELGQLAPGAVPGLVMNYLICTSGVVPPPEGKGAFPDDWPFVGQVVASAGGAVPRGWAACDGKLLAVNSNRPLFDLLGNSYGGDGKTNFALPDLRGKMVSGLPG